MYAAGDSYKNLSIGKKMKTDENEWRSRDICPSIKLLNSRGRSKLVERSSEGRSVDRESHDQTGDDSSGRQGDDPRAVRPSDHAPVDSLVVTRAETDADGGTGRRGVSY